MKLVHISDIHINSHPILDSDPIEKFARCLAHVEKYHLDADRVVITGDLTHHGYETDYRTLRQMLQSSRLKGDLEPRLLIGNHDDRPNFIASYPDVATDKGGYVQSVEETPAGLFVYLDTAEPGTHQGWYCARRQSWLKSTLESARRDGLSVWLFMHHNPIKVHVANADIIGLVQEREFHDILTAHSDIIRHIFFGHCHFTLSGSVAGIPYSAPRSTNHPCWPEFSGESGLMAYGDIEPSYNVCFVTPQGVVVHSIDFLREDQLNWLRLGNDGWVNDSALAD